MKILFKWASTETHAKELESGIYTCCLGVGVFCLFWLGSVFRVFIAQSGFVFYRHYLFMKPKYIKSMLYARLYKDV